MARMDVLSNLRHGWKIQYLIEMVFCQWSPAGLVVCRVLCLKRAYPKRLVVIPEKEGKCYWPKKKTPILYSRMQGESSTKKVPLTERLQKEDADDACIQEAHLNTSHRFSIRGYQTFRLDSEGRHKGGVLILVRNNIAASDFKVDANQQAEIHGVNVTVDNSAMSIHNLYSPPPLPPSSTNISSSKI